MDGQIVREIDRLDPFKALPKMRLHAQRVLDSQSNEGERERAHDCQHFVTYLGAWMRVEPCIR